MKLAFQTVDPGATFLPNWHIDCIAEYLEACHRREIKRLIINIPPRYLKSIMGNVGWPAWELGLNPSEKLVSASYSQTLSLKHSTNCRLLLRSAWYKQLFPEVVISDDQDTKEKFATTARGYRYATSVRGSATGDGGNILLVDDPLNPLQASSDIEREHANTWFDQTYSNRLDDKQNGVIVVIMQRLHQADLTGHLLEKGGWEHLKLQGIAESRTIISMGGFNHIREKGEILHPAREDAAALEKQKTTLGAYGFSGQYQQEPSPTEGGMFNTTMVSVLEARPVGIKWVRKWDLAATAGGGDYTVGMLQGKAPDGRFIGADVIRFQGASHEVEKAIINTAAQDGTDVTIHLNQDPGQAGKAQAAYLTTKLAGYHVIVEIESGDKATRAMPVSSQVNVGNFSIVKAPWNKAFLEELKLFPNGMHDDQVDALSGGFNLLSKNGVGANLLAFMDRKIAAQNAATTQPTNH